MTIRFELCDGVFSEMVSSNERQNYCLVSLLINNVNYFHPFFALSTTAMVFTIAIFFVRWFFFASKKVAIAVLFPHSEFKCMSPYFFFLVLFEEKKKPSHTHDTMNSRNTLFFRGGPLLLQRV